MKSCRHTSTSSADSPPIAFQSFRTPLDKTRDLSAVLGQGPEERRKDAQEKKRLLHLRYAFRPIQTWVDGCFSRFLARTVVPERGNWLLPSRGRHGFSHSAVGRKRVSSPLHPLFRLRLVRSILNVRLSRKALSSPVIPKTPGLPQKTRREPAMPECP